ncbi:Arc family DNA-binding protein [Acinetobacter tibetensis]|uniref:Arc family DNA-binding protein n=1 Tax=Acinetobacter tibetensis TaxID=2943497 RepID=UPI003A4D97D5
MAKDFSQVNFRMPTELKEKLEEASKANERSLTSELVSRLEESFEQKNKNLENLSADELIYFIFNKLNSRGLSLTIEEIERSKQLSKKSDES